MSCLLSSSSSHPRLCASTRTQPRSLTWSLGLGTGSFKESPLWHFSSRYMRGRRLRAMRGGGSAACPPTPRPLRHTPRPHPRSRLQSLKKAPRYRPWLPRCRRTVPQLPLRHLQHHPLPPLKPPSAANSSSSSYPAHSSPGTSSPGTSSPRRSRSLTTLPIHFYICSAAGRSCFLWWRCPFPCRGCESNSRPGRQQGQQQNLWRCCSKARSRRRKRISLTQRKRRRFETTENWKADFSCADVDYTGLRRSLTYSGAWAQLLLHHPRP
ncbi:hypothetical protein K438DRAFT_1836835 [Mycena galopus ATCC 62051]|nr:hypothetical protein K438DRAFT_1836835 [Mycena galopus ATCC 62051]